MDDAFTWRWMGRRVAASSQTADAQNTARFGGEQDDEPLLIATIDGPIEIEMAKDALETAGIPVYVKHNSIGTIYGLSVGGFGAAEIWAMPALAERARDTLIGIGLLSEENGDEQE